jgi:predicted RNA binding protein YcfA (HicA-like mRNA interferase family)
MKAKELRRLLASKDCSEVRQKGSHLRVECSSCVTTIPVHAGKTLALGCYAGSNEILSPAWEKDG